MNKETIIQLYSELNNVCELFDQTNFRTSRGFSQDIWLRAEADLKIYRMWLNSLIIIAESEGLDTYIWKNGRV